METKQTPILLGFGAARAGIAGIGCGICKRLERADDTMDSNSDSLRAERKESDNGEAS